MEWRITVFVYMTIINTALCLEIEPADKLVSSSESSITSKPEDVADTVNDFGFKLLQMMMKQTKNENIVISPTSVAGLLAMILLGTVGKTHEELAASLGFSQDIIQSRKNHEQFGVLLQSLNANDTTSKTLYADAMFVDKKAKVRDLYRGYLSRVYNGDALSVDFKQAVEAKDTINEWVESHTEGRIENFLQKTLPADTKVVLLSALYFRGQWKKPFLEEYTQKMPFRKPKNEVMADLMLNMGSFDYISSQEHDMHMIALPYNDSITTMYALKPRVPHRLSLNDLMNRLNSTTINELINKMEKAKCVIRFPKMDLQSFAKLDNHLKSLGVQSLFTPGIANFALMVDSNAVANKTEVEILSRINRDGDAPGLEVLNGLSNPGLHVDSVIHNVKLTVNEYGTEAVAATSGVLARTAKLFYADSPFYIFIRNEKTKLITFSAAIFDPSLNISEFA